MWSYTSTCPLGLHDLFWSERYLFISCLSYQSASLEARVADYLSSVIKFSQNRSESTGLISVNIPN